jgi:soluble lytic murein transglycosylase
MRMARASKVTSLAVGALLAGLAIPTVLLPTLRHAPQIAPGFSPAEPEVSSAPAPDAPPRSADATQTLELPPSPALTAQRTEHDLSGVAQALHYYREGEGASGDAALVTHDPLVRSAMQWTFLRLHPAEAGLRRHREFLDTHPDWPTAALRRHAEDLAGAEEINPEHASAYLAEYPPTSPAGELAAALLRRDDSPKAVEIARRLWRTAELSPALEKKILKIFGGALTPEDHMMRAGRLWLRDQEAGASRAAALSGKEGAILLRAAKDVANGAPWPKAVAKLAAGKRNDPVLQFARIHALRKAEKIDEAAKLMLAVPHESEAAQAPDDWWVERRLLARKLLDAKDFTRAYKIASGHAACGDEARLEAEFTSGWIALRFLDDAALAAPHFETMTKIARTPASIARAAYWRGRVEEARGGDGRELFARAARESETYYGQLARARFGGDPLLVSTPPEPAIGDARAEPVRAAELLFALGEKETARQLALEASAVLPPEQMAALATVLAAQDDPHLALLAGKSALSHGVKLPVLAWPVNGAPDFTPLAANSAPKSTVLAIARQESAFDFTARSGVGAMGLMQMMEPTARGAAKRAGVAYDEARLRRDPAFNAQLGAFHLGELLSEYKGSHILTFAAYNAGGGNVAHWIEAYGDPRDPKIDAIDWIERIPFTETRNYVQRVVENLHMYRALLGERAESLFTADMRQKVAVAE